MHRSPIETEDRIVFQFYVSHLDVGQSGIVCLEPKQDPILCVVSNSAKESIVGAFRSALLKSSVLNRLSQS